MRIMVPNTTFRAPGAGLALRPGTLRGKTLGFLDGWGFREDDGTVSLYPLMRELKLILSAQPFGVAKFVWVKKANVAQKASAQQMEELVGACDVVVNGEAA